MLTFEEYNDLIENMEDEMDVQQRKINYRKMQIRKAFGLSNSVPNYLMPTPSYTGTVTSTAAAASISGIASAVSSLNSSISSLNIETIYNNDEELALLVYEFNEMKSHLAFLKEHGVLPKTAVKE